MADTLTITDNRTGKQYEVPVTDGTIRATDLRQIKTVADDAGVATYGPFASSQADSGIALFTEAREPSRYVHYPNTGAIAEQLLSWAVVEHDQLLVHDHAPVQAPFRTDSRTMPTFAAGEQVGTSRRATSPKVGTPASLPSFGSLSANQVALPGT